MNNQKSLLIEELREAQELIYEILGDTSSAVMDSKHPHYDSANVAFRQLELHASELADRVQGYGKKTEVPMRVRPRIKPINLN
jgi:hypothetical protein